MQKSMPRLEKGVVVGQCKCCTKMGVRVGGTHINCKQHSDIGEGGLCCTAIIRCCDSKNAEATSKQ